jgi:hypothetical protein
MEAVYMVGQDKQKCVAGVGDVVMAPGNLRGIAIGVKGTFVTVLAIGTSKQTGDTFVLTPRYIHDFPQKTVSTWKSRR